MKHRTRIGSQFEALEDRALPTTFGVPWADPGHLTLSFTPDGTLALVGSSSLGTALAGAGTTAAWEREILRAFQTWAAQANVNIGLVADGGQALGSVGAVEGDPRFGDIRVAAAALSPDALATTSPFLWAGTTLSGDMILNSAAPFSIRGAGYDLYSVAVHEAGHALGLDHSDVAGSVMNGGYALHAGLSASDIAAIQALYGARAPDAYDAARGNNTASTASAIPRVSTSQLLASGDLGAGDVDYYKFSAPALTATLSSVVVRLKASGLSLLTAKVTVYDAAGRAVTSAASVDPLNNDLQLSFRPGLLGGNYTIKVEGASGSVFDVGSYKLSVDFLSLGGLLSPVTNTLTGVLDGHANDTLATALGLQPATTSDARFDAIYRGSIEDATDVDTYKVRSDKFAAGTPVTLNVMVWGLDASPLDGRVKVFDASGNPVAFEVLANSRGLFSVQVLDAAAGQDYYVQVMAREGAARGTGNYFFAADFNRVSPMTFDGLASGSVAAGQTTAADALTVNEAGAYHFVLAAVGQTGDAATVTVTDQNGNVVFSLTAIAGRPVVTATAYLLAGTYRVRYSGAAANAAGVEYDLFVAEISDPVGPYGTSTSSPPSSTSPGSSDTGDPTTSDPSTSTTKVGSPLPPDSSGSTDSSTTTTPPTSTDSTGSGSSTTTTDSTGTTSTGSTDATPTDPGTPTSTDTSGSTTATTPDPTATGSTDTTPTSPSGATSTGSTDSTTAPPPDSTATGPTAPAPTAPPPYSYNGLLKPRPYVYFYSY